RRDLRAAEESGDTEQMVRVARDMIDTATEATLCIVTGVILSGIDSLSTESWEAFDKATKIDSKNSSTWLIKGVVLFALDHPSEALEAISQASTLDAKDPLILHRKGEVLVALGRHEEALEVFDKATKCRSSYTPAWTGKGLCHLE